MNTVANSAIFPPLSTTSDIYALPRTATSDTVPLLRRRPMAARCGPHPFLCRSFTTLHACKMFLQLCIRIIYSTFPPQLVRPLHRRAGVSEISRSVYNDSTLSSISSASQLFIGPSTFFLVLTCSACPRDTEPSGKYDKVHIHSFRNFSTFQSAAGRTTLPGCLRTVDHNTLAHQRH
jgi:hypothetical protein